MSFFKILLLSLFSIYISDESTDKLIFVATHFRHGARAPQGYIDTVKRLDYTLESWDNPGELTGMGKRMHYLLGLRNRERYINETFPNFLSSKFDPHEILIYSSSLNRTLLSVTAQLQGLFPTKEKLGETLDDEQQKGAKPRVNLSKEIEDYAKNHLKDQALPDYLTIAPVRMISPLEKKIIIYDIPQCLFRRDEFRKKNYETLESLKKIVNQFNSEYKPKLESKYSQYMKDKEYDIHFVDYFCDGLIAGYTEGKPLHVLDNTEINKTKLYEFCVEFSKLNFRDWISGDKDRTLATLEVSKLMREFIHYMRERVNIHKSGQEKEVAENKKDYSKPKMMMISGHDSTISTLEMFFTKIFQDNDAEKYYKYPYFATQVALEVVVNDSIPKDKLQDSDYKINYYFNDELIFTKNMEEFIKNVEPALWTDEKIDQFCNFTIPQTETDPKKSVYFYLTIAFSITTGLLLIAMIIVIVKCRKKTSESIGNTGLLLKNYDSN